MSLVGHRFHSLLLLVEDTPPHCHKCPPVCSKFGMSCQHIYTVTNQSTMGLTFSKSLAYEIVASSNGE